MPRKKKIEEEVIEKEPIVSEEAEVETIKETEINSISEEVPAEVPGASEPAEEIIEEELEPVEDPRFTPNARVCTCGRTVTLPIVGEEPTVCECGIRHAY